MRHVFPELERCVERFSHEGEEESTVSYRIHALVQRVRSTQHFQCRALQLKATFRLLGNFARIHKSRHPWMSVNNSKCITSCNIALRSYSDTEQNMRKHDVFECSASPYAVCRLPGVDTYENCPEHGCFGVNKFSWVFSHIWYCWICLYFNRYPMATHALQPILTVLLHSRILPELFELCEAKILPIMSTQYFKHSFMCSACTRELSLSFATNHMFLFHIKKFIC